MHSLINIDLNCIFSLIKLEIYSLILTSEGAKVKRVFCAITIFKIFIWGGISSYTKFGNYVLRLH